MERGVWWATVDFFWDCKESEMTEQLTVARLHYQIHRGFPGGSVVKNPPVSAGDVNLIPESGRFPGERNGNLLQCSCLGNPMDREAWQATVHGITQALDTTQQLNNNNPQNLAHTWHLALTP